MKGLLTYPDWKDRAIELYCSNENCKEIIVIDSLQVRGLIFCSEKCYHKCSDD